LSHSTPINKVLLVLRANGKNFSAGADLSWMQRMVTLSKEENQQDAAQLARLMKTLDQLSIPTLARIQGAAFGGAVGLIACCDIAVASKTSSFALSETKMGLAPATISPYVMAAIGTRQCRRLFLTAERFYADQAKEWGLIHDVVDHEALDQRIEHFANLLLQNGPNAMHAAKKLVREISNRPVDATLIQHTSQLIAHLRVSAEGQEGLHAFLQKRPPTWISKPRDI